MNVLFSPLDWGLGHASRLVPIIRRFIERDDYVVIAGSGPSIVLLEREFPTAIIEPLPSFSPKFSDMDSQSSAIFHQVPSFLYRIFRENHHVQTLVEAHDIDLIISDNRYGVRSKKCRSVFITHQFQPKIGGEFTKVCEKIVARILWHWTKKFDRVYVPDVAIDGSGYAGELAVPLKKSKNIRALGILSRFTKKEENPSPKYDFTAIISGPEPQRTIFEKIITEKFSSIDANCLIIRGLPTEGEGETCSGNITFINHLSAEELQDTIINSRQIICRSGYSSIMDLVALNRTAIFVPTPGQAEQEYLAEHMKLFGFTSISQKMLTNVKLF